MPYTLAHYADWSNSNSNKKDSIKNLIKNKQVNNTQGQREKERQKLYMYGCEARESVRGRRR
jgi:hypothetical protein